VGSQLLISAIPYAVLQIDRGVRRALRGFGGIWLVILLVLAGASVPLFIEGSRQQPIAETVDGLRDGVSSLSSWVRMSGRIVTLTSPKSVAAGQQVQSLLIEDSGDAILMTSQRTLDDLIEVTGRVSNSADADGTARRIGGPRLPDEDLDIVDRYVLTVDDPIVPQQDRDWTLVWVLVIGTGLLVAGRLIGYPVIRLSREASVQAAARPLAVGEAVSLRVVEPERETARRLVAPRGELRRLPRTAPDDPYFSLSIEGRSRPLLFRRHRWSSAAAGTLWTIDEQVPVIHLRDWGIEVLLALDSQADRARVLASFLLEEDPVTGRQTVVPAG